MIKPPTRWPIAVPKAKPLLMDAVKSMSVEDAKKILSGGDDSVTRYFKDKTQSQLAELFEPAVKESTDKLSLSKSYNSLAGKGAGFGLLKELRTGWQSLKSGQPDKAPTAAAGGGGSARKNINVRG